MVFADALSCLPGHESYEMPGMDAQCPTGQPVEKICLETDRDESLWALCEIIRWGWPDSQQDIPPDLQAYWTFRDKLSVDNGIIIKGDRLVIPQSMWEELLAILHTGHLGMEKTKLKARSSVYWPGINQDIYSLVQECKVCQEHQRNTKREPLLQHEIPPRPWHTIESDMFTECLIVIDYYSKFPVVKRVGENPTSYKVISTMKEVLSEYGIPGVMMSDNRRQYDSEDFQKLAFCYELNIREPPRFYTFKFIPHALTW